MQFFRSTSGRLLALSIAIAFVCGGVSALMPRGAESTFVLSVSLFLPVAINAIGLPLALERHWDHAAMWVASLPALFLLWAVGVGAIRAFHTQLAYPFIVLGLGALAVAVRPSQTAAAPALVRAEQQ
jgi:predicted permease